MKRKSAMMKSAAGQRLTLPLSAAWAPELIAVRIAAVLMPPRADMTISRFNEPYISRRTSVKKDIAGCGPFALVAREPLPAQRNCVEFFKGLSFPVTRIGLEADPLSQWLHASLIRAGFETVLLETPGAAHRADRLGAKPLQFLRPLTTSDWTRASMLNIA